VLRSGQFFKLPLLLETGSKSGMWTTTRYREWLESRDDWALPPTSEPAPAARGAKPRAAPAPAEPDPAEPPTGRNVIVIKPEGESLSDILSELDRDEPRPPKPR
jgi:hypothetical protein